MFIMIISNINKSMYYFITGKIGNGKINIKVFSLLLKFFLVKS